MVRVRPRCIRRSRPCSRGGLRSCSPRAGRSAGRGSVSSGCRCLRSAVGVVTGIGAFLFRELIGLVHNLFFLQSFSFAYDSSLFTPSNPWGPWVILVPVVGAIGVTFIVAQLRARGEGPRRARGDGRDLLQWRRASGRSSPWRNRSPRRWRSAAAPRSAAKGRSSRSARRSARRSGQLIRMPAGQRITLVAAGAGAGIAATFNTPIGGVLFATELMLPEISVNTFLPVAVATGTATFIGRLFFGPQPAFSVPAIDALPPGQPGAGARDAGCSTCCSARCAGLPAALFIRGLHWAEDVFERIPGRYMRHVARDAAGRRADLRAARDGSGTTSSRGSATRRSRRSSTAGARPAGCSACCLCASCSRPR